MTPTPFYDADGVTLYVGDCLDIMPALDPVDAVITDPPYGDTSLDWDRAPDGRWVAASTALTSTLWCFGSLRFFLTQWPTFCARGWRLGQEIVWEKHNGSGFAADRFKRVHELAVQFYSGPWELQHRDVPTIEVYGAATSMTVRRKQRPTHTGHIEASSYVSEDGPRLQRSVIQVRSEHGRAVHPTQKPLGIVRPLVTYSVPPGGVVLDPFAGSGTTLLAAREQGKRAIGIEINEEYAEAAAKRLAQGDLLTVASTQERTR